MTFLKVISLLYIIPTLVCTKSEGQINFSEPLKISQNIIPSINASLLFDRVDLIQLSNSPLIGRIGKIMIFRDIIYILDLTQKSVVCFDKGGNYINQFSKIGRGPLEYRELNDFDILEDKKKVVVLTNKNTIYEMDLDLNNQKLQFKTEFNTTNFSTLDSETYIFYTPFGIYNEGIKKWIFDELISYSVNSGKIISLIQNSRPVRMGYSTSHIIFKSRYILSTPLMQYSIYFNSSNQDQKTLSIDFGRLGHTKERLSGIKSYNDWVELTSSEGIGSEKVKFLIAPFIVRDVLFFDSVINGYPYFTVYNFMSNESFMTKSITNDFHKSIPLGKVRGATPDALIAVIEPVEIIRSQTGITKSDKSDLIVNETDNPVIALCYVKKVVNK